MQAVWISKKWIPEEPRSGPISYTTGWTHIHIQADIIAGVVAEWSNALDSNNSCYLVSSEASVQIRPTSLRWPII